MKKSWIFLLILALMLCGCAGGEESEQVTAATAQPETQMTQSLETEHSTVQTAPSLETQPEEKTMSEAELAEFQVLFEDPMDWYARALTSVYDHYAAADLEKMFYCGAGDTRVSEEEREYLESRWNPILFEFDIVRCDEAVMEEAMQLVFGEGLEASEGAGLGNMTYYNGAYFRSSSDVLITIVRLDRGIWLDDGGAELYYMSDVVGGEECCIRMELLEGRWVIRSNRQVN